MKRARQLFSEWRRPTPAERSRRIRATVSSAELFGDDEGVLSPTDSSTAAEVLPFGESDIGNDFGGASRKSMLEMNIQLRIWLPEKSFQKRLCWRSNLLACSGRSS